MDSNAIVLLPPVNVRWLAPGIRTKYLSPAGLNWKACLRHSGVSDSVAPRSAEPVMYITGMRTSVHDCSVRPRFAAVPWGDITTAARTRGSESESGGSLNVRTPLISIVVKAPYEWPPTPMRL